MFRHPMNRNRPDASFPALSQRPFDALELSDHAKPPLPRRLEVFQ